MRLFIPIQNNHLQSYVPNLINLVLNVRWDNTEWDHRKVKSIINELVRQNYFHHYKLLSLILKIIMIPIPIPQNFPAHSDDATEALKGELQVIHYDNFHKHRSCR